MEVQTISLISSTTCNLNCSFCYLHKNQSYKEFDKLEELYKVLKEEPTLYEEFITKYNISHALELKDSSSNNQPLKNPQELIFCIINHF